MDYHDCVIWALRFDDNLYFDLDVIVGTIEIEGEFYHKVRPATFVFYEVENFSVKFESVWANGLEIDEVVEKKISDSQSSWEIELQEGRISFIFSNYTIFFKKEEMTVKEAFLSEEVRGGYNFDLT